MERIPVARILAVVAGAMLVVATGCSTAGPRAAQSEDHGEQVIDLLRERDYATVAAALPTPPRFIEAEVDRYRAEVRQVLRILAAEFGEFGDVRPIDDGSRYYSLRVTAPEHFECRPVASSFEVAYARRGSGVIHLIYCGDRPEITLASIAYGLDSTRPDARGQVVDVCTATTVAMGWAVNVDAARTGCESTIPDSPTDR